jgi:putative membrane protein
MGPRSAAPTGTRLSPLIAPSSDPRVFFASERTLLAWIRTGVAIIILGFVVSRFGLFFQLVALQSASRAPRADTLASGILGLSFVLFGAAAIAVATVQHGRFIATLPEHDRPAEYSRHWALWLSALVSIASLLLAGYLALALR